MISDVKKSFDELTGCFIIECLILGKTFEAYFETEFTRDDFYKRLIKYT